MDTQLIEIMGRNRLTNELIKAGLEVAHPMRDRGIDLIAYWDVDDEIGRFAAFPIQMKASSTAAFHVGRKYDKFPNLIMAYIWGLANEANAVTYALTQREATQIAQDMGWTTTVSWIDLGGYGTNKPSKRLVELLVPYQMTPTRWREKLLTLLKPSDHL